MYFKKQHRLKVRVYYEDTDSGGIVYHSKYLNFAERSRTEFLRKNNLEQKKIKDKYGIVFVVKSLQIDYINFACLDDLLVIKTIVQDLNKAKVIFKQLIYKNKNIIAKILATVCCINNNGKICRMNDKIYYTLKMTGKETL